MPRSAVSAQPAMKNVIIVIKPLNRQIRFSIAYPMAAVERDLFGISDDPRVNVSQVSITARLFGDELAELGRHYAHDVCRRRNDEEAQ